LPVISTMYGTSAYATPIEVTAAKTKSKAVRQQGIAAE